MKRRQFMKSALAASATPMVPAGLVKAVAAPALDYAKAAKIARDTAWVSSTYLKYALGLDDRSVAGLVQRLQADGLLGQTGKNGLLYSKSFFSEHARLLSKMARVTGPVQAGAQANAARLKARERLNALRDVAKETENPPADEAQEKPQMDEVEVNAAPVEADAEPSAGPQDA